MGLVRVLWCPLWLVVAVELLAAVGDGHLPLRVLPASDSAMAIACLRLLTFGPLPGPGLPLWSVPRLNSPITLATLSVFFFAMVGRESFPQG